MNDYLPSTTAGWCCFAFAAVILFLLLWARREGRRTRTMKAAAQFRVWGATDLAELFEAYTIGNYLGRKSIVRVLRKLIDRAQTEGVPKMFKELSSKIVDFQLKTEEGREALAEKLRIATEIATLEKAKVPEPTPETPIEVE